MLGVPDLVIDFLLGSPALKRLCLAIVQCPIAADLDMFLVRVVKLHTLCHCLSNHLWTHTSPVNGVLSLLFIKGHLSGHVGDANATTVVCTKANTVEKEDTVMSDFTQYILYSHYFLDDKMCFAVSWKGSYCLQHQKLIKKETVLWRYFPVPSHLEAF